MLLLLALAHADPLTVPTTSTILVAFGEAGKLALDLRNEGAAPVHVNEVALAGDPGFTVVATAPVEVPAGQSLHVELAWAAGDTPTASTTLLVRATEGVTTVPVGAEVVSAETPSAGTASAGEPIVLGSLEKSVIDAVIKKNMRLIRKCYTTELKQVPSLAGRISIKFKIAPDGRVSSAVVKSTTMTGGTVEACLVTVFKRFVFEEPKGGGTAIVSYPFIFSPG